MDGSSPNKRRVLGALNANASPRRHESPSKHQQPQPQPQPPSQQPQPRAPTWGMGGDDRDESSSSISPTGRHNHQHQEHNVTPTRLLPVSTNPPSPSPSRKRASPGQDDDEEEEEVDTRMVKKQRQQHQQNMTPMTKKMQCLVDASAWSSPLRPRVGGEDAHLDLGCDRFVSRGRPEEGDHARLLDGMGVDPMLNRVASDVRGRDGTILPPSPLAAADAVADAVSAKGQVAREATRRRAETLRLRLGLASYKVRTGQTELPLDRLVAVKPTVTGGTLLSRPSASVSVSVSASPRTAGRPRAHTIGSLPHAPRVVVPSIHVEQYVRTRAGSMVGIGRPGGETRVRSVSISATGPGLRPTVSQAIGGVQQQQEEVGQAGRRASCHESSRLVRGGLQELEDEEGDGPAEAGGAVDVLLSLARRC